MIPRLGACAIASLVFASLAACSSGSSSGNGGGSTCASCESSTCSAAVSACNAQSDCKPTLDCLGACNQSDLSCVGACSQPATPAGQSALDPVLKCWCGSCASQCGLMPGYGLCK